MVVSHHHHQKQWNLCPKNFLFKVLIKTVKLMFIPFLSYIVYIFLEIDFFPLDPLEYNFIFGVLIILIYGKEYGVYFNLIKMFFLNEERKFNK